MNPEFDRLVDVLLCVAKTIEAYTRRNQPVPRDIMLNIRRLAEEANRKRMEIDGI